MVRLFLFDKNTNLTLCTDRFSVDNTDINESLPRCGGETFANLIKMHFVEIVYVCHLRFEINL